ncbi:hypothetical protein FACS1894110_22100 [Spirochaetia bacterium]|nr:hypothetical protein FACS1894110_22100 [Spirochaetia bacterium]
MKRFSLIVGIFLIGTISVYADDFVQITDYFWARFDDVYSAATFRNTSNFSNSNQVRVDLEAFFGRRLAKCFFISSQDSDDEDKAVEQECIDLLSNNINGYPNNISIGATYNCIYIRTAGIDGYLIYMRYTSRNSWEWYTYYYSFNN